MNPSQLRKRSILLMVICAALWSIAGIFIKLIPWNPFVIAGARSFIASFAVLIYMRITKVKFRINRASILSGIMLSATFMAFVSANKMTTAANAIVLQFTAPVFILLLSFLFYRQRFRRSDLVVVSFTMLGIILCFFDQLDTGNLAGNGIAILSGLFLAAMYVFTGKADNDSRMSGIFLGQVLTAVIGLPMALVFPTPVSTQAVTSIVILGILQLGIPYILYGVAVRHCSSLICCLVGAIEPLLNPVWVFLFNGEAPGAIALVGSFVVIASITVWSIWSDKMSAKEADATTE